MNTTELFESWYFGNNAPAHATDRANDGEYKYIATRQAWQAWESATLAEREECAKICDEASTQVDINSRCFLKDAYKSIGEILRMRYNVEVSGGASAPSA